MYSEYFQLINTGSTTIIVWIYKNVDLKDIEDKFLTTSTQLWYIDKRHPLTVGIIFYKKYIMVILEILRSSNA